MAPPDTQRWDTQSAYGGSSMMKAIAEPLLELGTHPDMTPTRVMISVMIRGGRSLVSKLVLGGSLGAALLMLGAFGVLALPLSFFSDEGELLLRRTPKRRLQYNEPQA